MHKVSRVGFTQEAHNVPHFYCDKHDDCVEKNKSFSKNVDLEQHIISRMIDQKEA